MSSGQMLPLLGAGHATLAIGSARPNLKATPAAENEHKETSINVRAVVLIVVSEPDATAVLVTCRTVFGVAVGTG